MGKHYHVTVIYSMMLGSCLKIYNIAMAIISRYDKIKANSNNSAFKEEGISTINEQLVTQMLSTIS